MRKNQSGHEPPDTKDLCLNTHLKTSLELLDKLFMSTHFLIAYLDPGFFFLRVNDAFARTDGRTPDYYPGKSYFDLYPDEERKRIFQQVVTTRIPYNTFAQPFTFHCHPGQKDCYMEFSLQPTKSASGHIDGLILVLVDVTKRKQAEEELKKTQKQLADSKRLADIGKLAAIVAHEFRNPLGVIQAAVYNIRDETHDVHLSRHLTVIEKKIQESEHIINNLLSYSCIRKPDMQPTPIIPLINECIESVKKMFKGSHVQIHTDFQPIEGQSIVVDPYQIKEVIINILNNAFQSIEQEKGIISIKAMMKDSRFCVLFIKDNGEGIKKENLDAIFDPFFSTKSRGTGLGLSICREIISLHNGKISIKSQKNNGTEVRIQLKIDPQ